MSKSNKKFSSNSSENKDNLRFYETWTFLILFCIFVPILIRSFVYTPFHIPSGSMKPTLLIGDYIFVSKFSYGYSKYSFPFSPDIFSGRIFASEPKRGDIIVFRKPTDTSMDYIKRLVGLPGDTIQVIDGILHINGEAVNLLPADAFIDEDRNEGDKAVATFTETLPGGVAHIILDTNPQGDLDNTPQYKVPEGHYFFMGDNRDNSQDSRVQREVGFVPLENLIGRADLVFISTDGELWKIWQWFRTLRADRSFTVLSN